MLRLTETSSMQNTNCTYVGFEVEQLMYVLRYNRLDNSGSYRVGTLGHEDRSRPPTGEENVQLHHGHQKQQQHVQQHQYQQHLVMTSSAGSLSEHISSAASNAGLPANVDASKSPTPHKREYGPVASFSTLAAASIYLPQYPIPLPPAERSPQTAHAHNRDVIPSCSPTSPACQALPSYLLPKARREKTAKRSPSKSPNTKHSADKVQSAANSLLEFDIDHASIHRSMQKSATLPLQPKRRGPEVPVAGWNKSVGIAGPQESSDIVFDEHWSSSEVVGLLLFEESLGNKA
jgi:hypothetical protein